MILNDRQILDLCENHGMITPYVKESVSKDSSGNKVLSYGPSSFGYDVRLANEFVLIRATNHSNTGPVEVDPKDLKEEYCDRIVSEDPFFLVPPFTFVLAKTVESFKIPRNVTVTCVGKSTVARTGLYLNVTPLEAGWEGVVTLELFNSTANYVRLYINEGIGQLLFSQGEEPDVSYADRGGKYQGQQGVTLPKMVESSETTDEAIAMPSIDAVIERNGISRRIASTLTWIAEVTYGTKKSNLSTYENNINQAMVDFKEIYPDARDIPYMDLHKQVLEIAKKLSKHYTMYTFDQLGQFKVYEARSFAELTSSITS